MTNKNRLQFIALFSLTLLVTLGPYFYFLSIDVNKSQTTGNTVKEKTKQTRSIATIHKKVESSKLPTYTITVDKKDVSAWESGLYQALLAQGKENLTSIELVREKSFLWPMGQAKIEVESVKISLRNLKHEETSFRAMVDARNGKILQTWDQTIDDPANPRERLGFKLDPRYLE